MKRGIFWLVLLLLPLAAACTVTTTNLRLEQLSIPALPENEVNTDLALVKSRAEGLWGALETAKLTTYLTKKRISPYFENDKDRSDFTALYSSLFREKRFAREFVSDYEIGKIVVEPNGAIAHVEMKIWGKIYFIWRHRIHDVQTWKKVNGEWVMKPESY